MHTQNTHVQLLCTGGRQFSLLASNKFSSTISNVFELALPLSYSDKLLAIWLY